MTFLYPPPEDARGCRSGPAHCLQKSLSIKYEKYEIIILYNLDIASQGVIFRLGNATNAETVTSAKLNVYAFRDRRFEHRDETVSVILHRILAPGECSY